MIWHDGSTINAHSYLLIMISYLYDPACHLTDKEFKNKYGINTNVQSIVEIYLLSRYPPNDQQILYSKERFEDLFELKSCSSR